MLIKFGLKEFKKDFVRNIPVILQMDLNVLKSVGMDETADTKGV